MPFAAREIELALGRGIVGAYVATSSVYSDEDHERWRDKEGYDACYKIHSITDFLVAVYPALGDSNFVLLGNACYYDETAANNKFEGAFHPALLKRKAEFGGQNEVRFIWEPKENAAVWKEVSRGTTMEGPTQDANAHRMLKLSPRNIIAPDIGNYCVRHRVLPPKQIHTVSRRAKHWMSYTAAIHSTLALTFPNGIRTPRIWKNKVCPALICARSTCV